MYYPAGCETNRSFYVSESSLEEFDNDSTQSELSEKEIAAIRRTLQKLSRKRVDNPTDAEDLVQDTLLTMLTKNPGRELDKGLLVWSMGILRKKVGNYYRRPQRFTSFNDAACAQQPPNECITPASPESELFYEELRHIVAETLAQFPAEQRKALELLMTGLPSGEIVRQLHPERYQNVINRIHRGRKRLASELAKYGYGPNAAAGMMKMKRSNPKKHAK